MRVVVFHSDFGCDTGCCGHTVEVYHNGGTTRQHKFFFDHPYDDDPRAFAEQLVREEFGDEHVADLDWNESWIVDD